MAIFSQDTSRETHQREVAQTDQRTASLRQKGRIEQEHLEKIGCQGLRESAKEAAKACKSCYFPQY